MSTKIELTAEQRDVALAIAEEAQKLDIGMLNYGILCAEKGMQWAIGRAEAQAKPGLLDLAKADEAAFMRAIYTRVIGNAHPEEEARIEVAYAIARYLKLDCPCAYQVKAEAKAGEPAKWECRRRAHGRLDWSTWEACTAEQAKDFQRVPPSHEWHYQTRALYTAPQPQQQGEADALVRRYVAYVMENRQDDAAEVSKAMVDYVLNQAAPQQPEPQEETEAPHQCPAVPHEIIAGALFDFMGFLTTRDERLVLSACDEASPAVQAIEDFASKRRISIAEARVMDWRDSVAMESQQPEPITGGTPTSRAFEQLKRSMQADPGYAWTWHCNIAMASVDEGMAHDKANAAAARFMSWCFGVDMTNHEHYAGTQIKPEPSAELSDALERVKKRYEWAANELLACDYGDNDQENKIGWHVYGWRDKTGQRRIYGPSIDAAIDAEIAALEAKRGQS